VVIHVVILKSSVHILYSSQLSDLNFWLKINLGNITEHVVTAKFRKHRKKKIPYILESNPHPVFGDFLNEKI
jgi:hypothetical protein